MAGEYDAQFDQLTGLVETLSRKVDRSIGGLDELRLEMRDLRTEVSGHTSRFNQIDSQIALVSGRQGDIVSKVIDIRKELTTTSASSADQSVKVLEMWNRLSDIQGTFQYLDERVISIEMEVKNLTNLISEVIVKMDAKINVQTNIEEIDRRITRIEERLAA